MSKNKIEIMQELRNLIGKTTKNKTIYARVETVSSSGMSRSINFYCVVDGKIRKLNYYIHGLLGYRYNKDYAIVVGGCGMDMIFNTVYNLNWVAYDLEHKRKNKRRKDIGYHYLFNSNYDGI